LIAVFLGSSASEYENKQQQYYAYATTITTITTTTTTTIINNYNCTTSPVSPAKFHLINDAVVSAMEQRV